MADHVANRRAPTLLRLMAVIIGFLLAFARFSAAASEYDTVGPLWCYYCNRNCDLHLGAAVECPGQNQLCGTIYEDSEKKKIVGRDCVTMMKGCFPIPGGEMACACNENLCNNRRYIQPFYEDRPHYTPTYYQPLQQHPMPYYSYNRQQ